MTFFSLREKKGIWGTLGVGRILLRDIENQVGNRNVLCVQRVRGLGLCLKEAVGILRTMGVDGLFAL